MTARAGGRGGPLYRRIVVALDGSELAERVLPHAEALAERFGAALDLLRATTSVEQLLASQAPATAVAGAVVTQPLVDPTAAVDAERREARAYLEKVARRLRRRGRDAAVVPVEGAAADAIVGHARRARVDLIALTTHGRGGLGRLVLGSVADAVVRGAPCPVLLVRLPDGAS